MQEVKRYIIRKHLDWLNIRGQETSEDVGYDVKTLYWVLFSINECLEVVYC